MTQFSFRSIGVAAALLLLASTASAQETYGPEFGSNKMTSELASLTDRPDVDSYVADLMAGETLSVTVSSTKKSAARFVVRVIDPDGDDRTSELTIKANVGKKSAKVQVKKAPIDKTGRWTVRIEATESTEGGYQAAFKIAASKGLKGKKLPLGGIDEATRVHRIGGLDGGTITLKVSWGKKDAPVELLDLRGPEGTVDGIFGEDDEALRLKKTSLQLKKYPLEKGTGTYEIEVGSAGESKYTITAKITAPPRPKGKTPVAAINDPHLDTQELPVRSAAGQPIRITGRNFSINPLPTVRFGPFIAPVIAVGGARNFIDVVVPPGADGTIQPVIVSNPDSQSASHDNYIIYVSEASIDDVAIADGPVLGADQVLASGGARLLITGQHFLPSDSVTLGGAIVGRIDLTGTSFSVVVPPGPEGLIDLILTDEFGRVQTASSVVRRVAFEDITTSTTPGRSPTDDLSAFDAVIGDLDRDGRVDDVVIVTYNRNSRLYPEYYPNPGTGYAYLEKEDNPVGVGAGARDVYTRLFVTDGGSGRLSDRTSSLPSNGTDSRGVEDFNALAVAIGDIDGQKGAEIVLAGSAGKADTTVDFSQVRILSNNGTGAFKLEEGFAPISRITVDFVVAFDETYVEPDPDEEDPPELTGVWPVVGPYKAPKTMNSLAIGDLDGDGDNEIIAGSPGFAYQYVNIDPTYVDFSQTPPYVRSTDVHLIQTGYYFSGTRIFDNDVENGNGFQDITESVLPSAGTVAAPGAIAFPARHIAVGDVDMDDDLDVLVTWSNPASMIPASAAESYGEYLPFTYGRFSYIYDSATADPVVATRVLLNDGAGNLSDATDTWMPAANDVEYWQAHRMALVDLDGDGKLDLILQHRRALNEWRAQAPAYNRSSLRILHNDGESFVDVTSTALPALTGGSGGVLRGRAIAVGDIDQDGHLEIVVGTSEALQDQSGATLPSTRILWGRGEMRWEFADDFVVPTSVDSGEVHALLLGDLDADGVPSLLMFGEFAPTVAPGSSVGNPEFLRVQDWLR